MTTYPSPLQPDLVDTHIATIVAPDADLLCEACGYILSGLPEGANCPECGRPVSESRGDGRRASAFEERPGLGAFFRTAWGAMFRPKRFYGSLSGRAMGSAGAWFARGHRALAAVLMAVTVSGLLVLDGRFKDWLYDVFASDTPSMDDYTVNLGFTRFYWADEPALFGVLLVPLAVVAYALIALATRLGAALAVRAAKGQGAALRKDVARRALGFHAVHLVPAAFVPPAVLGGPLALQITPLVLVGYVVFGQIVVWGARLGRPWLRVGWGERVFRAVRLVAVTLLLGIVVGKYFMLFDSPYFDRIAVSLSRRPPEFWYLMAAGVAAALGYVVLTGWVAVKRMMYVNVREDGGGVAVSGPAARRR